MKIETNVQISNEMVWLYIIFPFLHHVFYRNLIVFLKHIHIYDLFVCSNSVIVSILQMGKLSLKPRKAFTRLTVHEGFITGNQDFWLQAQCFSPHYKNAFIANVRDMITQYKEVCFLSTLGLWRTYELIVCSRGHWLPDRLMMYIQSNLMMYPEGEGPV